MGLDIKKNKQGLYQVKCSTSDELLNENWISEDDVKKILIERAYFKFIEEVIKIDFEFPSGYYINGKSIFNDKHLSGSKFIINNWKDDDAINDKFKEICERLDIEI
jgi:hypothetical protein